MTSGPHGLSRLGLGLLLSDPLTTSSKITNSLKDKAIKLIPEYKLTTEKYISIHLVYLNSNDKYKKERS